MQEEQKKDIEWGTMENLIWFVKHYAWIWFVQSIFAGIIALVIVMTLTGTPISTITDKWFNLKETELTRSYDLQLRQLQLTEEKIIPKLDSILERLQSVEQKVNTLETRVSDHDRRLDQLEYKVK